MASGGRRWFAELAFNRAADTLEIAKREGVHDSYVRRLVPLAFLAPSIVEAICAGRQPPDLTAERLTRRARLPYQWAEQQKALGLGLSNRRDTETSRTREKSLIAVHRGADLTFYGGA